MFFIFKIVPEWFWTVLLLAGLATYIIGYFSYYWPFIRPYALVLKIVGGVVVPVTIFILGVLYADNTWKAAAAELQTKIAVAEAKAGVVNTVIEEKLVTKIEVVKVRGDTITEYIDREVVRYDSECKVPDVFVDAHNQAAKDPR
jgi:uncharacterized membrane protein